MDKQQQRITAKAARGALTPAEREEYSRRICRRLMALPQLMQAGTILSYWAVEAEASLALLHGWAREQGKTLAFPYTEGRGQMTAYAPNTPADMAPGSYGILTPVPERSRLLPPEALDVVLVPCLAFDETGGRLGHGGGYYDRYLPRCPRAVRILTAFQTQCLPRVQTDRLDVPMDMGVTESAVYRFSSDLQKRADGAIIM